MTDVMNPALNGLPAPRQLAMLAVASLFTPARIWAANTAEVGLSRGLLIWSAILLILGLAVWVLAVGLGRDAEGVTYSVFWALLAVGALGSVSDSVLGGEVSLTIGTLAFAVTVYQLRQVTTFQRLTLWIAAVVVLIPVGEVLSPRIGQPPSAVNVTDPIEVGTFARTPDVVILVFDGHGALAVLESLFGFDEARATQIYEQAGLSVVPGMNSNYPLTHYSLASLFEMDYPLAADAKVGFNEWTSLLDAVRGNNRLVDAFKAKGYSFVLVESGWSGLHCTGHVDECVRGGWRDEATARAINRSLFRSLQEAWLPNATTSGSIRTIDWLRNGLPSLLSNDRMDLVFAHLMIPHPPLYLDAHCEYRHDPVLGFRALGAPSFDSDLLEVRKRAYIEQVRCAQDVVLEIAAELTGDEVLIVLSDHGPDSGAQLFKAPEDWTRRDIEERFPVLFLTNTTECEFTGIRSLVNVGRKLLGCLSGEEVQVVEDRFFIAVESKGRISDTTLPILELPPEFLLGAS